MSLSLYTAWVATTIGLLRVGEDLDKMMETHTREELSAKLCVSLSKHPTGWIQSVNDAFFILFDRLYRSSETLFDKIAWRAILGAYVVLVLVRVVLWVYQVPPPATEQLLITALGIAIISGLFMNAMHKLAEFYSSWNSQAKDHRKIRDLLFSRNALEGRLSAGLGLAIGVAYVAVIGAHVGTSARLLIAYGLGTALSLFAMELLYMIPDRFFPVSPLRTVVSSLLAMLVVAMCFPVAARSAWGVIAEGHWKVSTYLCFNIFADAISLLETRWILRRSRRVSISVIGLLLILDLILSALLYLVLPGIADQDYSTLFEGIMLRGPHPWMGILFWSTFATSIVFYLFVAAALLIALLVPVLSIVRRLDHWFSIYKHPVRLVAISMVIVESVVFAFLAFM